MNNTPKTLTVMECHQLLDALLRKKGTQKQFRNGIRNYTMALLMLDAGLRVGEVVSLKIGDLFIVGGPVRGIVVSAQIAKSKTERTVPVSSRLRGAIQEFSDLWYPAEYTEFLRYAFHRSGSRWPMTTRQVERIIRAAAMKSIGRPVHPHVLRHTFASRLMRKTNARIVQELLGHAQMSSTQIYTHPNEDDKKNAIKNMENSNSEGPDSALALLPDAYAPNRIDTPGTDHHHR